MNDRTMQGGPGHRVEGGYPNPARYQMYGLDHPRAAWEKLRTEQESRDSATVQMLWNTFNNVQNAKTSLWPITSTAFPAAAVSR